MNPSSRQVIPANAPSQKGRACRRLPARPRFAQTSLPPDALGPLSRQVRARYVNTSEHVEFIANSRMILTAPRAFSV